MTFCHWRNTLGCVPSAKASLLTWLTENGDALNTSALRNLVYRFRITPMLNATRVLVVVTPILLAAGSSALCAAEPRSRVAGVAPVAEVLASVSGTVSVAGNQQRAKPLPVFKNRSFCGAQVPNETLLVGRHGGLRNAVLTFHPLHRKAAAQPMKLVLDNKHCAFAPHVQVAALVVICCSRIAIRFFTPCTRAWAKRLCSTSACRDGAKLQNGWTGSASSESTAMSSIHG